MISISKYKITLDEKGFMRIDKRISFDPIFQREIQVTPEMQEFLEKARAKDDPQIKFLVENL